MHQILQNCRRNRIFNGFCFLVLMSLVVVLMQYNLLGCLQEQKRKENQRVDWFPASEVNILSKQMTKKYEPNEYEENKYHDISLKLINSEKVAIMLTKENFEVIVEAESQKSDLIPGKYEGKYYK